MEEKENNNNEIENKEDVVVKTDKKNNTPYLIVISVLSIICIILLVIILTKRNNNEEKPTSNNDITQKSQEKPVEPQATEPTQPSEPDSEDIDLNDYVGVWQYFEGGTNPEMEIIIKSVSENRIDFDYEVYRIAGFEGINATFNNGIATFSTDEITGTITFEKGKILLKIDKSSNEYINPDTIEFTTKAKDSALQ